MSASRETRLVLASNNAKKLAELDRIVRAHTGDSAAVDVIGMREALGGSAYDEPVEDQPTFEGNALLKARAAVAVTGLPAVADDSGLCVDALNGMPGVLSARWSGQPKSDERNNALLLDQLADVPDERRGAHFACAIAYVHPDGTEIVEEGRMRGRVIRDLRGDGGFGYDVLFVADEHAADGRTCAELRVEEKDAVSHRGRALRALVPQVLDHLHLSARATKRDR